MTDETTPPGIDMSGPITPDEWSSEDGLRERLITKADKAETSAGMQDARHDGGAATLRAKVALVDALLEDQIPEEWKEDIHKLRSDRDPEISEFRRQQTKFQIP